MEFEELLSLLKCALSNVLDSDRKINENDVKQVSIILKEFAKLKLIGGIRLFLDEVLRYFVVLNLYTQHNQEANGVHILNVRMGLGVFLFVVDKTKIYDHIIGKFRKIIDVVIESEPKNPNIKEYLRIYSHFLDQISKVNLRKVTAKHQSFSILYNIVKNTCDIETQAIALEVVLKLYKCNTGMKLEAFLNVLQSLDDFLINNTNMYQNIRIILDHFNENSANIFSINCNTIEIDSRRVVEFNEAQNNDDIWLDVDLVQKKLSFFCDQKFATTIHNLKLCTTSTTWEVLSFYATDAQKIDFNLFANINSNVIHRIEIEISKYSDRFNKLMADVLPILFINKFPKESLNISSKEDTGSIREANISDNSSSPVIEHFEKSKKISTKNSIITLSEDESLNNVKVTSSAKPEKVFNGNFNSSKKRNIPTADIHPAEKDELNEEKEFLKVSQYYDNEKIFNKSISPFSFTESVFNKKVDVQKKKILPSAENSDYEKIKKISTIPAKVKKTLKKKYIDKDPKRLKISASTFSPVVNPIKPNKGERDKGSEPTSSILFQNEERIRKIESCMDDSLNCSIYKVHDWLKNVDETVVPVDETEHQNCQFKVPLDPSSSDFFPSISARNTGENNRVLPVPLIEQPEVTMHDLEKDAPDSPPIKIKKRKLYNPGDLSYLNSTLPPRDEHKSISLSKSSTRKKLTKSKVDKKTRKTKRKSAIKEVPKKIEQVTTVEEKIRKTDDTLARHTKNMGGTYIETALACMRQRTRDHKIKKKLKAKPNSRKKKSGKRRSSSSTSSMESFHEILKTLRQKKRQLRTMSSSEHSTRKEEETNESNKNISNKKIHIISDVVIRPAVNESRNICLCLERMKTVLQIVNEIVECKLPLDISDGELNETVTSLLSCISVLEKMLQSLFKYS